MPKGLKTLGKAAGQRITGDRPSRLRASAAGALAGGTTAVVVYRALRS